MLKRFITYSVWTILFAAAAMLFSGCGGQTADAPLGSTITIDPEEVSVSNSFVDSTWSTSHFQISVKNENGIPLNNVKLWISFVYAVPHEYGFAQLYDGDTLKDSPMSVTTDENGVYNLRFDYQEGGGLEYSADILVNSGSASASAEIKVDTGE